MVAEKVSEPKQPRKKKEGEEQVLGDKNRIGLAREIFLIIIQELEEN